MQARTVFVTGSSRGIGLAIARQLSADGFHVILHGTPGSEDFLRGLVAEIDNSSYRVFDLCENPESAFRQVIKEFDGLYGLINNAGAMASESFFDTTYEDLEQLFRINTFSHFILSREFMNQAGLVEGRIVNISTNVIKYGHGRNNTIQYTSSKLALEAITAGLSKLGAKQGVLVNTVRPGTVNTRMQQQREDLQARLEMIPLKRMVEPSEIAELVGFLLSEKSSYITGQTICIAGGE